MSKIQNLIREKNLTPEEIESLKQIILECEERERRIDEACKNLRENLSELFSTLSRLSESADNLSKSIDHLVDKLEEVYLLCLPKERFYSE